MVHCCGTRAATDHIEVQMRPALSFADEKRREAREMLVEPKYDVAL